jgi:hypothetical protein
MGPSLGFKYFYAYQQHLFTYLKKQKLLLADKAPTWERIVLVKPCLKLLSCTLLVENRILDCDLLYLMTRIRHRIPHLGLRSATPLSQSPGVVPCFLESEFGKLIGAACWVPLLTASNFVDILRQSGSSPLAKNKFVQVVICMVISYISYTVFNWIYSLTTTFFQFRGLQILWYSVWMERKLRLHLPLAPTNRIFCRMYAVLLVQGGTSNVCHTFQFMQTVHILDPH